MTEAEEIIDIFNLPKKLTGKQRNGLKVLEALPSYAKVLRLPIHTNSVIMSEVATKILKEYDRS